MKLSRGENDMRMRTKEVFLILPATVFFLLTACSGKQKVTPTLLKRVGTATNSNAVGQQATPKKYANLSTEKGDLYDTCENVSPGNALISQTRRLTNKQIQTELQRITGENTNIGATLIGGINSKFEESSSLEINSETFEDLYNESLKLLDKKLSKTDYSKGDFGWLRGLRHNPKPGSISIEVDGKIEDDWARASWVGLESNIQGIVSSRTDLSAITGMVEKSQSVVFAVRVIDNKISTSAPENYNQDSVELYLASGTPNYNSNATQLIFRVGMQQGSYKNVVIGKDIPSLKFAHISTENGYNFEIEVAKSDLGISSLADLRLDVHVNDADETNTRKTKLAWNATEDNLWKTPENFGTAQNFLGGMQRFYVKCNNEEECLNAFIPRFAKQAFRASISSDSTQKMLSAVTNSAGNEKFKQLSLGMLLSAEFLFQKDTLPQGVNKVTKESALEKLSFSLTDQGTDSVSLFNIDSSLAQDKFFHVKRFVSSLEGKETITSKLQGIIGIGTLKDLVKTGYPNFTPAIADALNEQFKIMLSNAFVSENADFRTLLTSSVYPINSVVAGTYDQSVTHADFRNIKLDELKYSGILTSGAYLTQNGAPDDSSPVFRGVHALKDIMCYHLNPAPANIMLSKPDANKTVRQNFENSTSGGGCAGCHNYINPVGFSLDNFDGVGKFRTMLKGKPIDTNSTLTGNLAFLGTFSNGAELSRKLGASTRYRQCFTKHIFTQLIGTTEKIVNSCAVLKTESLPEGEKYNLVNLILSLIGTEEYVVRK
jgi:Protein of unknown function (DUF1588)/Carbohydrate family 9 binding domain-like